MVEHTRFSDKMNRIMNRIKILSTHLHSESSIALQLVRATSRQTILKGEDVLKTRTTRTVLGSYISYLDTGGGDDVVILFHGNPTCAYLWRNVIPHVAPYPRCLAPDLIGMGRSGKLPGSLYRFEDHYKYLSAWIDSMQFPGKITIVCHDWGSALGFHWCNMNRDRVKAMAYMECILATLPDWDVIQEAQRETYIRMRSDEGERFGLEENFLIETALQSLMMRRLSDEEFEPYRAPYRIPGESRRPLLTWCREVPHNKEGPFDVVNIVKNYRKWLSTSANIPKLYIHAQPGYLANNNLMVCGKWPNQTIREVRGLLFVQEDCPDQIGQFIGEFVDNL